MYYVTHYFLYYNIVMKIQISARIDESLADFLESYQQRYDVKNRSEALEQAIEALRERALTEEYAQAMEEWESSGDAALWEGTVGDGITSGERWE